GIHRRSPVPGAERGAQLLVFHHRALGLHPLQPARGVHLLALGGRTLRSAGGSPGAGAVVFLPQRARQRPDDHTGHRRRRPGSGGPLLLLALAQAARVEGGAPGGGRPRPPPTHPDNRGPPLWPLAPPLGPLALGPAPPPPPPGPA